MFVLQVHELTIDWGHLGYNMSNINNSDSCKTIQHGKKNANQC